MKRNNFVYILVFTENIDFWKSLLLLQLFILFWSLTLSEIITNNNLFWRLYLSLLYSSYHHFIVRKAELEKSHTNTIQNAENLRYSIIICLRWDKTDLTGHGCCCSWVVRMPDTRYPLTPSFHLESNKLLLCLWSNRKKGSVLMFLTDKFQSV